MCVECEMIQVGYAMTFFTQFKLIDARDHDMKDECDECCAERTFYYDLRCYFSAF